MHMDNEKKLESSTTVGGITLLTLTFFSIAEKLYLIFRQLAKFLAKKG